jgi:hypothetical protein
MRALIVLVLFTGCGGAKSKAATFGSASSPPSVLERRTAWNDIVVAMRQAEDAEDSDADSSLYPQQVGATSPTPPAAASPAADPAPVKSPEKLVIEAWIAMHTKNVATTVAAIRARVEQNGGHVVSENINGSESLASSASIEFRLPPQHASAMTSWLGSLGTVTSKRTQATEVSKTLFDQELALQNLAITMARLQALAEKGGPIDQVLAIEKELTRVRGEIETIKGEHRWLLDRVAYATISVTVAREGNEEYDLVPEARIYPGPIASTLVLIDPGTRQRTRLGAGMSVRVRRHLTFDLAVFPRGDGGDSRAVIATVGTALYSGYLGYGQRRYLNPYIGARAGYGYVSDAGGAAVAAELGVELFKHQYLLVDTAIRTVAFVREEGSQAALQGTLGVSVPF